jgi:alpha-1,2-mannosyltransferase
MWARAARSRAKSRRSGSMRDVLEQESEHRGDRGGVLLRRPVGLWWLPWALVLAFDLFRLAVAVYPLIDLDVYRQAGVDVVTGVSPYAARSALPFTYPPFAALLATPFAVMPPHLPDVLMSALSAVALGVTLTVVGRRLRLPGASAWWVVPICVGLTPVWRTFDLGQVNLLLLAFIVVDALVASPRWRGFLTGVATGIKLTPGIFVLYYLVTRQWRAAVNSGLGFLATVVLGALLLPEDSRRFWFVLIRDPSRVGDVGYPDNQALNGALSRVFPWWTATGTLLLALVVIAAGLALAVRLHARGSEVSALATVGLIGLVASPVSWSHHWVWVIPAILWLLANRRTGIAIACCAAMSVTPLEWAAVLPPPAFAATFGWLYPAMGAVLVAAMLARPRNPLDGAPRLKRSTGRHGTQRRDPLLVPDEATPSRS